jgi:hypothetical protein
MLSVGEGSTVGSKKAIVMNLMDLAILTQQEAKKRKSTPLAPKKTFATKLDEARQDLQEGQKLLREA